MNTNNSDNNNGSSSGGGGGCRVITIENESSKSKLHPLSAGTRIHIMKEWKEACADQSVTCMVLIGSTSSSSGNFSAGADISEFGAKENVDSSEDVPSLTDICEALEKGPKPIIAALGDGVALGGGLELALACHGRVATTKTIMGLPEVHLGLIPGAGGTQRMPRLVGIETSLHWIVSGTNRITASQALSTGLIDQIATTNILEMAQQWAKYCTIMNNFDHLRTCNRPIPSSSSTTTIEEMVKKIIQLYKVLPKDKGGEAKHAAIQAICQSAVSSSTFEEGMELEAELFWDLLLNSEQGRAYRHVFFAQRQVTKPIQTTITTPLHPLLLQLNQQQQQQQEQGGAVIGVIGAGTMGSGIAINFLLAGYTKVYLVDVQEAGLKRGVTSIASILKRRKKDKLFMKHLHPTTNIQDLKDCHLVVEAVFEKLSLKQQIFSQLNKIVQHPQALLLTNTSTMDIDQIIAPALSPSRRKYAAGMHFFSPAHVMKLVEIVISPTYTSDETTALLQAITKQRLKKVGVTVYNSNTVPGFVGNRMLFPYTTEAALALVENAHTKVHIVDKAIAKDFGMAIGPLTMGDLAGNDIGYLIRLSQNITDPNKRQPSNMRYSSLADELVTRYNRVGQKARKGWYDYNNNNSTTKTKKPIPTPSTQVSQLIQQHRLNSDGSDLSSSVLPCTNVKLTNDDIVEKLLFPLVNEGFKVLEEGVARHPHDVDIIYIYGYGWPSWRGGPMYWADYQVGLPKILSKLTEWSNTCQQHNLHCQHLIPSKLLQQCVQQNTTLHDFYKKMMKHGHSKKQSSPHSKL